MAAFDAPDGPLNGSGRLAVQVLICPMRPRAFRSAGKKAFTTDSAPKPLTSNPRRTAYRDNTSSGPGVKIPALLISRSRPRPSPRAADTRSAHAFTSCSFVISQIAMLTRPSRALTSASVVAVPNTVYPFSASPSAMSRPRPLPAPVMAAERPAGLTALSRPSLEAFVITCVPFAGIDCRRRGPAARGPSGHAKHDLSLSPGLGHRVRLADLRERQAFRDGNHQTALTRRPRELREPPGIEENLVRANGQPRAL